MYYYTKLRTIILTTFGAGKAADDAYRFECEVIFNKFEYFF